MKKIIMALVIIFIVSVVFTSMHCARMAGKGWEKTVTLPSGKVILDMSGEWDALIELLERYKWTGLKPEQNILLITQEGTTFSAVAQIEAERIPKGTEKLKGVLDKDGFKEVQLYAYRPHDTPQFTWVPVTWEISENGNKIVFVYEDAFKWTLTRR